MKKYLFYYSLILIFDFNLKAQSDINFPSHNYSEASFQVEKLNIKEYKIIVSDLGKNYLNPFIKEIVLIREQDSLQIQCEIFEKIRCQRVDIYLLKIKKGIFHHFTKYRRLKISKFIGEFETKSSFFFIIPKNKKFILLFKNKSIVNDDIAIEFINLKR